MKDAADAPRVDPNIVLLALTTCLAIHSLHDLWSAETKSTLAVRGFKFSFLAHALKALEPTSHFELAVPHHKDALWLDVMVSNSFLVRERQPEHNHNDPELDHTFGVAPCLFLLWYVK